jgi:Xaa-Pro aminopeptidase
MAIEPKLVYPDGSIGIEDTWLQTDGGLEKLTLDKIGDPVILI